MTRNSRRTDGVNDSCTDHAILFLTAAGVALTFIRGCFAFDSFSQTQQEPQQLLKSQVHIHLGPKRLRFLCTAEQIMVTFNSLRLLHKTMAD